MSIVANMVETYEKVSKDSEELLNSYIEDKFSDKYNYWNLRERFETIDRSYLREARNFQKDADGKVSCKENEVTTQLTNIEPPLVFKQAEAFYGYLVSTFLNTYPIFSPVADKNNQTVAEAVEAELIKQSDKFAWTANLINWAIDLTKYDYGATEISWDSVTTAKTENNADGNSKRLVELFAGNRIKHLDIYNTVWDNSVLPYEVHTKGEYAGYTEAASRHQLKTEFLKMQEAKNPIHGTWADYENTQEKAKSCFYVPTVNSNTIDHREFSWDRWFSGGSGNTAGLNSKKDNYVKRVLYCRIIPADFKIKVPQPKTPQAFKLVYYGDKLFSVKLVTNDHGYLPIIIATTASGSLGYQNKSVAENVVPYQELSTALITAKLDAARRAATDRALYNPRFISPEQINTPNPSAKIPLRNQGYTGNLNSVYMNLPFDARASQVYMQDLALVDQHANDVNGINPAMQGQFVKGNKSPGEFNEIMGNANDRVMVKIHFLEATFFSPVKTILKSDNLQFLTDTKVFNPNSGEYVSINITELRAQGFDFKLADGILNANSLTNINTVMQMMQTLPQMPGALQTYDFMGIIVYYLQLHTKVNLDQFKYTPEQQQAQLAAQQPEGGQQ